MPRRKLALTAVLAALVPVAHAASDEALAACRALKDSGARLACYDALPLPSAPARGTAVAPSAPPAGSATAAPSVQTEAARFGLPATTRPAPIESVDSRIDGHFAGWYPNTRIRLANGQVWQVTDGSSRFANVENPKVTVRRGALGSFFLDIDGVNPAPRVKRIE